MRRVGVLGCAYLVAAHKMMRACSSMQGCQPAAYMSLLAGSLRLSWSAVSPSAGKQCCVRGELRSCMSTNTNNFEYPSLFDCMYVLLFTGFSTLPPPASRKAQAEMGQHLRLSSSCSGKELCPKPRRWCLPRWHFGLPCCDLKDSQQEHTCKKDTLIASHVNGRAWPRLQEVKGEKRGVEYQLVALTEVYCEMGSPSVSSVLSQHHNNTSTCISGIFEGGRACTNSIAVRG